MDTLRVTRRSRGLTQAAVANSAKISLPTLRALERSGAGVGALVAVMAVLDLRWGWAPGRVQAARERALADRRRARGLSQGQLANRIGVSRPVIIALERDLGATVATLVRAAAVLAEKVIGHFADRMTGTVLDPARGRFTTASRPIWRGIGARSPRAAISWIGSSRSTG